MDANMLGPEHLRALAKTHTLAVRAAGNRFMAGFSMLAVLTGHLIDRMTPDAHGWLKHPNGTTCEHCAELLTERWMCTLCAHGEQIQQHAHFDAQRVASMRRTIIRMEMFASRIRRSTSSWCRW